MLGKGEFGEVYSVLDLNNGNEFACKVIEKCNIVNIPYPYKSHIQEITFMDIINNINVIHLHDYVESNEKCFIFMDKYDTDLEQLLI